MGIIYVIHEIYKYYNEKNDIHERGISKLSSEETLINLDFVYRSFLFAIYLYF